MNDSRVYLPIDRIKPDPNQPRKIFSAEHIQGLADSLATEGMINPIECDSNYTIITGGCRYKAAQLLNWKKIPVIFNTITYSEYERLRHQMAENIHHSGHSQGSGMNPIDTAKGYARLFKLKTGKDWLPGRESRQEIYGVVKELAIELGVSDDTIHEYLLLLEKPEFVQQDIEKGRPRTHYREVDHAPVEFQEPLQKKIAQGEYQNRGEIRQDIQLLYKIPNLTQVTLERQRLNESKATSRILNAIPRLGLALEALPYDEIHDKEKDFVTKQLRWITQKIAEYLEKEV